MSHQEAERKKKTSYIGGVQLLAVRTFMKYILSTVFLKIPLKVVVRMFYFGIQVKSGSGCKSWKEMR